jgi:hypothetical protein
MMTLAARSKAWVYCRSLAWIAVSNIAGVWMSVSCEYCVLSGRGLCDTAERSSRGFLPTVVCRCEIEEPQGGGLGSLGLSTMRISRQVLFVIFYA